MNKMMAQNTSVLAHLTWAIVTQKQDIDLKFNLLTMAKF